ncbi:MAG TPA: hypothetical protein VK689_21800, partial [Armatimonadota bacterium]|nr:hypothetical protein [Armatimonadota bacterium]
RPQHMLPPLSALVGTRDHLIVCHAPTNLPREPAKLMAISLETGKTAWSAPISGVGQVATANSLLFITEPSVSGAPGGRLTAYAPAERTYHMAIDSPHPEEYRPLPVPAEAASEAGGDAPAVPAPTEAKPSPEEGVRDDAAPPPADPRALADATILRMRWGEPREELLRKALARRAAVPGRPLVLVLDWLNGPRTGRIGPHPNAGWEAAERQQFAETCAQLAAAVKPEHFEVGSDVNVYLARYPDQLEPVRALIRTARAAIQRVSPATGVLFSFNAEVLTGTYGRGGHLPFTDVPLVGPTSRGKQVTLVTEVDEVGLTTYPQAGNIQPNQMARDYFIKLRRLLGGKPVLLTRVAVHWNDSEIAGLLQTQYLKHLFRVLYWLDARVVAYPDLTGAGEGPVRSNAVLWLGGKERPALQVWWETLDWRQVPELTAKVPEPDAPVHQPD